MNEVTRAPDGAQSSRGPPTGPTDAARAPPALPVVAQEPFARIEDLGFGMYAIVSTPLDGDYTTVCNGGIIMGRGR